MRLRLSVLVVTLLFSFASFQSVASIMWYVSLSGNDANDCLSAQSPCATINAAIQKASSLDTIFVSIGTYTGSIGDIQVARINKDVLLSGGWNQDFVVQSGISIIDGELTYGGIVVFEGSTVTVENFIVQQGASGVGSGISVVDSSTLNIDDSIITDNPGGGISIRGGGSTITNSIISNNGAALLGGGIYASQSLISLNNSEVIKNTSTAGGGGIYVTRGELLCNKSTINGNTDYSFGGGGIVISLGSVALSACTISNNEVLYDNGGGLSINGAGTIENSTISGNIANQGGGIFFGGSSTILVNSSTIANNTARNTGGGIYSDSDSDASISNTIIANNNSSIDTQCDGIPIISLGYNLASDESCNLSLVSDKPSTNPLLGLLQGNGGPTFTHALLAGSPAIDAGQDDCTDVNGQMLIIDQRSEPRPVDGNNDGLIACDIGAYEVQLPTTVTVTIDILPKLEVNMINLNNRGSIQVAILSSDDFLAYNEVNPDSVTFGPAYADATRYKMKDVNRDGLLDILLYFKIRDTGIECGDTEATLTGETFDGRAIEGTDSIVTKGCGQ